MGELRGEFERKEHSLPSTHPPLRIQRDTSLVVPVARSLLGRRGKKKKNRDKGRNEKADILTYGTPTRSEIFLEEDGLLSLIFFFPLFFFF